MNSEEHVLERPGSRQQKEERSSGSGGGGGGGGAAGAAGAAGTAGRGGGTRASEQQREQVGVRDRRAPTLESLPLRRMVNRGYPSSDEKQTRSREKAAVATNTRTQQRRQSHSNSPRCKFTSPLPGMPPPPPCVIDFDPPPKSLHLDHHQSQAASEAASQQGIEHHRSRTARVSGVGAWAFAPPIAVAASQRRTSRAFGKVGSGGASGSGRDGGVGAFADDGGREGGEGGGGSASNPKSALLDAIGGIAKERFVPHRTNECTLVHS